MSAQQSFDRIVLGYQCLKCKIEYKKEERIKANVCCYIGAKAILDYSRIGE